MNTIAGIAVQLKVCIYVCVVNVSHELHTHTHSH